MSKSLPTSDELVGTLKRTSLPTLVIEGNDDVFIYRWLKNKLGAELVSLLPCGGRNTLFKVYERRSEFSGSNVVFVADKDSYVFEGVDESKGDIIFTSGYCIENDIYSGSNVKSMLDREDSSGYELLRKIICSWFVFELDSYSRRKVYDSSVTLAVSVHINQVCPVGSEVICPGFSEKINYVEPSPDKVSLMIDEYHQKLRGKQIFQMLSRFMSGKGRFSSFSDKNLIEIALKQGSNPYIDILVKSIDERLAS